jgi:hypothetical protein
MQRALMPFFKPENYFTVREELTAPETRLSPAEFRGDAAHHFFSAGASLAYRIS